MANYIGVYATKERPHAIGEFPRPLGMRKRLWFVWEMPEGLYKVQALNAALQPMAGARNITSKEFFDRFSQETECSASPAGYTQSDSRRLDAASVSLPDLFLGEERAAALPLPASAGPRALLADDPNLLLNWAKVERGPKAKTPEVARMPFDRLVGEFVATDGGEAASVAVEGPEKTEDTGENEEGEARQVRQLRSQFVQALLLLRRGAQAESLVLLETMIRGPYNYFTGGAQLFSEFGLGLRRLGYASLALAAHKRALEFAPKDERIFFNIARSYHDLGLLAEARDFLEQALALSPEFAPARQFLTFLTPSGDDAEH